MLRTAEQINELKALIKRTVSKQSEYLFELEPQAPFEFECIKDLSANFKIRLRDNISPLTINFGYSDNLMKFV